MRGGDVCIPLCDVAIAQTNGNEKFNRLADEFLAPIPEEPFGLGIDEHDPAGGIGNDQGIRHRFQQAEKRLRRELRWDRMRGRWKWRAQCAAILQGLDRRSKRGAIGGSSAKPAKYRLELLN